MSRAPRSHALWVLVCAGAHSQPPSLSAECSDFSPPVTVILLVFLCLESLLFFTFTAVMFGTQIHSICNDETVRLAATPASRYLA